MSAPSSKQRLDFLDVARGAAAMLVVVEHGLHRCVKGYWEFSHANVVIGQAAILVFFMISGFVIPMSLEAGRSNASFWVRRCFRLFPVYWFSTALAFGYLVTGGPTALNVRLDDWPAWCANLVLLQGWLKYPHVWQVYWSLHFEVAFYVICSALFACGLLSRMGVKSFAGLLIGFCLAATFKLLRTNNPTDDMYNWMIGLSALFGMTANRYASGRITRRAFYGLLTGLFAALLFVWCVNHVLFPTVATFAQLWRSVTIGSVGYGAFVCLLELRHHRMLPAACALGRRSYPIYLVHPFVLLLMPAGWSAWSFMPTLSVCTLLLAEATHRLIERPGIALGRRLENRWTSRKDIAIPRAVPRRQAA